jgi:beta-xylosidase
VSSIDPTPADAFGHGLSYTTFEWTDLILDRSEMTTDGSVQARLTVTNTGARDGVEVVQLYLHDPVAEVARPVRQLVAYARVPLRAGESAEIRFTLWADLTAYTGVAGRRIVEAGELVVHAGRSSASLASTASMRVTGATRVVGHDRRLRADVRVGRPGASASMQDPARGAPFSEL